jgi:hypothetical protein
MENLFLNKELSLLAKNKGFRESTIAFYMYDKLEADVDCDNIVFASRNMNEGIIDAPLYQQILAWFWKEHAILVYPYRIPNSKTLNWVVDSGPIDFYNTQEEAIKNAFKLI